MRTKLMCELGSDTCRQRLLTGSKIYFIVFRILHHKPYFLNVEQVLLLYINNEILMHESALKFKTTPCPFAL